MHKVHIAFGFHVNCYHSYRGDTPDATGFGGDIRIIRKIIAILNDLNDRGIPAKGTWDFENAYSLEEILPKYAPDIIEGVRERVEKRGDENIIMGYNNGALGAMTPEEFDASIQWAVTNEKGSGLADLFGGCAPIVRPQEVMFTPSQVRDYNRNGIEALCLYYSCVPFDAFRTIVPQLPDALAFNPLTYTYQGESLTVLPTYSNADVIDAGTLRALAKDLHAQQESGAIDTDVLVFINMDADAPFWEPLGLPGPLGRIPHTQGILGYAEEVADLDFVVFSTPGEYLSTHAPIGEIAFGHDTADGGYTGYASWAEKPFNRQIWTRLERARALAHATTPACGHPSNGGELSAAFDERVLLLSTTHFGLASPVLNIDRERRALALSEEMLEKELSARPKPEKLTLTNPDGGNILSTELRFAPGWLPQIEQLEIKAEGMKSFGGIALDWHEDGSIAGAFVLLRFEESVEQCEIDVTNDASPCPLPPAPCLLESGGLTLRVCEHGEALSVAYRGKPIAGKDFLRTFLTYDKKNYPITHKRRAALPLAGRAQGLRIEGELHLPGEEKPGLCQYDFFTLPGFDGILARMNVQYPYTREDYAISTMSSALGRYYDVRWQQAAPFQLTPRMPGELHVVKRNFAGDVSGYPVASFRESVPQNENINSFNHQLTGGFVGLTNGETGLLLANARQVLGSMAHCPMRLKRAEGQDYVNMNPFGTYAGPQRVHPSRGDGSVGEAFVMVTPQARSLAPAYNGAQESAVLALFGFEGPLPQGDTLQQACAFADGAVLLEPENSPVSSRAAGEDLVRFPAARENREAPKKLRNPAFSGVHTGIGHTAKVGIRAVRGILKAQKRAK
ncbi:MAG: glycosyl hydrolase family 57 [Firmicutes bacterium]|nr:glycosyl hydrolase family 57 [Bacillota bacterium]